MNEEELETLLSELSQYVEDYLREIYLNKEMKLLKFDNEMVKLFPIAESIYDYNVREMLENSFSYKYTTHPIEEHFNFEFEIIEDTESDLEIIVKIIDIYEV